MFKRCDRNWTWWLTVHHYGHHGYTTHSHQPFPASRQYCFGGNLHHHHQPPQADALLCYLPIFVNVHTCRHQNDRVQGNTVLTSAALVVTVEHSSRDGGEVSCGSWGEGGWGWINDHKWPCGRVWASGEANTGGSKEAVNGFVIGHPALRNTKRTIRMQNDMKYVKPWRWTTNDGEAWRVTLYCW